MRHLLALALFVVPSAAQVPSWIVNPTNGHEYALTSAATWLQAETQAMQNGAHLATVRNAHENAWLLTTFGATRWLGLSDQAQEGVWIWSSGEAVAYANWEAGQPDSNGGNEDYCCIHGNGAWHDDQTALFQGIMERVVAPQWTQNPANGHYYALTSPMSWTQAEQYAQFYGGHLATIRNAAENAWLAATFPAGLWIGLNDLQTEGSFVWSSGEPVTYLNWDPGQPDNGLGIEDCAHTLLPWGVQPNAKWNDAPDLACYGPVCRGVIEVQQLPAATYSPFGSACTGPSGSPSLAGVAGEPPRIGTTSRIRVSNLPLSVTVPIFVLGLSNTQDPGPPAYPLPLDLGVLGWPGCSQLVSDDVFSFAITTTGQADYAIAVPMNLGLVGFTFHAQTLVLYTGGGVAASNGVTGVVGY